MIEWRSVNGGSGTSTTIVRTEPLSPSIYELTITELHEPNVAFDFFANAQLIDGDAITDLSGLLYVEGLLENPIVAGGTLTFDFILAPRMKFIFLK